MPIRLTQTVKILLVVCFGSFVIQQTGDQFFGTHFLEIFALNSSVLSTYRFWQLFTYAFMHGEVMHLFFNLMMLAFIGSELEALWGTRAFLRYTVFCTLSAGLIFVLLHIIPIARGTLPSGHVMIGASAAIYGLLMAYGMVFGNRVLLFMMLFPMKAKHFIWVLASLELLTTLYSSGGAWAGIAQLGGMAAGFCYLRVSAMASKGGRGGPISKHFKKRRSKHLKLVVDHTRGKNLGTTSGTRSGSQTNEDGPDHPRTWH